MSKKILGDNPFTIEPESAGGGSGAAAASPDRDGEPQGDDRGDDRRGDRGDARGGEPAREPRDGSAVSAGAAPGGAADSPAPDAADPPTGWTALEDAEPGYRDDDIFLGGEAAVPEREYGPPIESVLPDPRAITREIRELERRVRARLTPAFPIEHRRRLPLEFLWKRYRRLAMRGRSGQVDDFGRDPVYTARFDPLLDFLYRAYFRVDAQGVEHVPDSGRVLLVANHSGTLPYDGLLLMHALRREHPAGRDARPLVEDFVVHFPYVGTLISRLGGVRACPENAQRLLENNQVVAVFPEGLKGMGKLYTERYKLQRFGRGGFVKLALRTRTPIVPVAIVGAEEAHPMLGKVTWMARSLGLPYIPITPTFPLLGPLGLAPLPSKWFIRFGPLIDVAAGRSPDAAADRILVNRLTENVRTTIQTMVDDILTTRKTVLFG